MSPDKRTPLDREHYPILKRNVGVNADQPLVYLDSAATALTSTTVTDAYAAFLHTHCANIHRGAHQLAEEATDAYENARERLAAFFSVDNPERVIFTHGATEALNMAALGWAEHHVHPGDVIAIAEDNHHSNIIPWLTVAQRTGAEVLWIPLTEDGLLDYGAWSSILDCRPRVVALCQQSNVLGFSQLHLTRIAADAHEAGVVVALDGAQAAGYRPGGLTELFADFYACSAHKTGGLTGVGALICSQRVCNELVPVYTGGGMAASVTKDSWEPMEGVQALEAGTPPIAAAVAWSAALNALIETGVTTIADHTSWLAQRARAELGAIEGVQVLGGTVPARFQSLVSFTVDGIHPHDVGQALSDKGIMVRVGHHCARPLHKALGVKASVRASFGGYSTPEDVDALVSAVAAIAAQTHRKQA